MPKTQGDDRLGLWLTKIITEVGFDNCPIYHHNLSIYYYHSMGYNTSGYLFCIQETQQLGWVYYKYIDPSRPL